MFKIVFMSGLLIAPILGSGPARAALGSSAEASGADLARMGASLVGVEPHASYQVLVFRSGPAEIREYLAPSDQVFALTWVGSHHPPMAALLGRYQGEYRDAFLQRRQGRPGRGPIRVVQADLVVELGGHFRRLRGRAFDPGLLPPGVSADEIR